MSVSSTPSVRRRWRPWKVLLAVLVALVLLFFGYQWYRAWRNEERLQAAIEATNRVDPQWRLADLVKDYEKLPVSKHFGPRLLVWRGYMGWFGDDIESRPGAIAYDRGGKDYHVRFPEPYFNILRERLQATDIKGPTVMREELEKLAKEPAICRVPFDDNNMLQQARAVSNYLLDEMELAAHEGRDAALIPLLRSQLKLSAYMMATPKPINLLVGMALSRQGKSGINRGLALGVLSPDVLAQAQEILVQEDQTFFEHILRSSRAEFFDDLERAGRDPVQRQKMKDQLRSVPLPTSPTIQDRLIYAWKWLEAESAMKSLPLAQAEVLEISSEMIDLVKTNPKEFFSLDPSVPGYTSKYHKKVNHLLARQFVNMCFKLTTAEASTRSELRSLIVALACERYRLATGAWPKALTDLQSGYLKEIPLDPYSGQALLFRALPDGVVIYSVGMNGVDDGGDVLVLASSPKDRGVKLFNPQLRGRKFEEVYPERVRQE